MESPLELPRKITGFLGNGCCASVFKVEYEGQEVAMKIPYYSASDPSLYDSSKEEFMRLEELVEVRGVPNPIAELDLPRGTYQELGLDACGEPLENVVHPDFLKNRIVFRGGFLFDYIEHDLEIRPITLLKKGPTEEQKRYHLENIFFERLEQLIAKIHQKDYCLPADITILVKGQEPYLIDWSGAIYIGTVGPGPESKE